MPLIQRWLKVNNNISFRYLHDYVRECGISRTYCRRARGCIRWPQQDHIHYPVQRTLSSKVRNQVSTQSGFVRTDSTVR